MISRSLKPAALCCVIAALAGCASSPIPVAENFQITSQKKVRSAGHWNLLSQDVIEQTVISLDNASATPQTTLYVALPANPSDFDLAFHEFLVTGLVQKGRRVMSTDTAMLTLSYQTQIVTHNSDRPHFMPGRFTAMTALGAGLYAMYNVANPLSADATAIAALALAGAADLGASVYTGGPTHTELILTSTVTGAGRYMSRKTDVYYVEESDTSLFRNMVKDPLSLGLKSMKVVAE